MEIRTATMDDFSRILEIYADARAFMARTGNPNQWGATNWPPEALIRQDIAQGHSYVCTEQGRVIGVFYFIQGHRIEPCYDQMASGHWLGDEDYGVIHRIAGDGSQKGIGSFCIQWAYRQCGHLRMDTHGDNRVMQQLLLRLGFTLCGTIHVQEDNDLRLAYEKL